MCGGVCVAVRVAVCVAGKRYGEVPATDSWRGAVCRVLCVAVRVAVCVAV